MQTITRRQFVATSVVSLAAAKRLAAATLETNHKFTPGCQIFGVRHQLVADFDGTLKQLYDAGYRVIEYCSPPGFTWDKAGLGTLTKLTAKETRSRIEAAGLRAVSCHYQYPELKKHLDERIEFAKELGLEHMVVATMGRPETLDGWMERADDLNRFGEKVKQAGMQLGFHNHGQEWRKIDGVLIFDALTKRFDPKLVNWQYHLQNPASGGNPADVLERYAGRVLSLHIMDYSAVADEGAVPVGQGTLDWKKLFTAAKACGVKYYFVEMDMDAIKASGHFLKSLMV
jgi:sugar phosphate isomerase/epimerase